MRSRTHKFLVLFGQILGLFTYRFDKENRPKRSICLQLYKVFISVLIFAYFIDGSALQLLNSLRSVQSLMSFTLWSLNIIEFFVMLGSFLTQCRSLNPFFIQTKEMSFRDLSKHGQLWFSVFVVNFLLKMWLLKFDPSFNNFMEISLTILADFTILNYGLAFAYLSEKFSDRSNLRKKAKKAVRILQSLEYCTCWCLFFLLSSFTLSMIIFLFYLYQGRYQFLSLVFMNSIYCWMVCEAPMNYYNLVCRNHVKFIKVPYFVFRRFLP